MGTSRLLRLACVAAWILPLCLKGQSEPQLSNILQRLERLEQENRSLAEEVRTLRNELAAVKGPGPGTVPAPEAAAPAAATLQERVEIQEQRVDEQAQSKVEASQKFPLRLTGMLLFNAFMNSRQSGGSQYPVVAAATGPGLAGASVRQTIIGLDFQGPATLWGGKIHGSAFMDFFLGGSQLEARLRTGSVDVEWKTRSVMAGLEKPIFNPREPSSLAQVGISPLTGAGNLWLWLPQFRVEQDIHFAAQSGVRAQLGVVETRETGPYVGMATVEADRPALEGRFNFFHNLDDERRLEFAPGFHTSTTHAAGQSIPSTLYSFDWFFNPWKPVEFSGVFYNGQNVAHLGSGTRQGFGLIGRYVYAVQSIGGWGQVTVHAAPRLDFHLFTGEVHDFSREMAAGAIGKNILFGGNGYFRLAPNVLLGLEATQVRTVYLGQGTRINNHYDLALAYLF